MPASAPRLSDLTLPCCELPLQRGRGRVCASVGGVKALGGGATAQVAAGRWQGRGAAGRRPDWAPQSARAPEQHVRVLLRRGAQLHPLPQHEHAAARLVVLQLHRDPGLERRCVCRREALRELHLELELGHRGCWLRDRCRLGGRRLGEGQRSHRRLRRRPEAEGVCRSGGGGGAMAAWRRGDAQALSCRRFLHRPRAARGTGRTCAQLAAGQAGGAGWLGWGRRWSQMAVRSPRWR
jgi:hypothetical protein